MAKDPAFLFYDGDAARDVSHMNRLERGAYFDFMQAQKKFGPLNIKAIQKILGRDFDSCWPALIMCLSCVNDMYFIAWLKDSIEKRQKYSEGRSKNRKGSKQLKNKEKESTYVKHMENAIENVIEDENGKGVKGERFSDERFNEIFDSQTMDDIIMVFPQHDIANEMRVFRLKVRGSPKDYVNRDSGGIRQAFIYQLKTSKATNGQRNTNQGTPTTAIIEPSKSFGAEKGFSRSGANGGGNRGSAKGST